MSQEFRIHRYPNGITLVGEEMDSVTSAAMTIIVPVGACYDPVGQEGLAFLLNEMFEKGAGPWNAQELSQQFEDSGIQRGHSIGSETSTFSFACLGENLRTAIKLAGTMLLRPNLPEEELPTVRDLALQELNAIDDEPQHRVMIELAKHLYSYPFSRYELGTVEGVSAVTIDSLRAFYGKHFPADRVVIGVAGKFKWAEVRDQIGRYFGEWSGSNRIFEPPTFPTGSSCHHVPKDTNQQQIALAYENPTLGQPDYYTSRVSVGVLSGGMAGRLFVEVREKRGLVYHVSASHSTTRARAAIIAYAGTTPDHAEETLAVTLKELRGIKEGVTAEELTRSKADLKSKVVMQSELSGSRASAIASDWWYLRRIRTVEEIKQGINSVTDEDIRRLAASYPVNPVTMATVGPKRLELPS